MKNRIMSLTLALIMSLTLCVPAFALENNSVHETYLTAEEIVDGYYVYRDEAGNVVATQRILSQNEYESRTRAAVRPIDWVLPNGGTKHDSVLLDPTSGTITIYVSIDFGHEGKSYLGWFDTRGQTYNWMSDYKTNGFYSEITLGASSKVNLAIKNSCGTTNRYIGNYSLAPF